MVYVSHEEAQNALLKNSQAHMYETDLISEIKLWILIFY